MESWYISRRRLWLLSFFKFPPDTYKKTHSIYNFWQHGDNAWHGSAIFKYTHLFSIKWSLWLERKFKTPLGQELMMGNFIFITSEFPLNTSSAFVQSTSGTCTFQHPSYLKIYHCDISFLSCLCLHLSSLHWHFFPSWAVRFIRLQHFLDTL